MKKTTVVQLEGTDIADCKCAKWQGATFLQDCKVHKIVFTYVWCEYGRCEGKALPKEKTEKFTDRRMCAAHLKTLTVQN